MRGAASTVHACMHERVEFARTSYATASAAAAVAGCVTVIEQYTGSRFAFAIIWMYRAATAALFIVFGDYLLLRSLIGI